MESTNYLLPSKLESLLEKEEWKELATDRLKHIAPYMDGEFVTLLSKNAMEFESGAMMGPEKDEGEFFCEYRGSKHLERELPWIDVEKTLFFIVSKIPGYDSGFALDYRTSIDNPRVIASDWTSGDCVKYRKVASNFDEFISKLKEKV